MDRKITDYPICNPVMYVGAVYCGELSESDGDLIILQNAERLLGKAWA